MEEKQRFNSEDLEKALYEVDELFFKSHINKDYILLKETARAAKNGVPLYGDGVDIGVQAKFLTGDTLSFLNTFMSEMLGEEIDREDKGFEYSVGEVPVRVRFIHKHYKFLKFPESKIYQPSPGIQADDYQIPNPFDDYWKARFLVQ